MTEAVLRQLDRALLDHELVKVKVGTETPEDRFEYGRRAPGRGAAGAQLAQILGRTLLALPTPPGEAAIRAAAGGPFRGAPTRADRQARRRGSRTGGGPAEADAPAPSGPRDSTPGHRTTRPTRGDPNDAVASNGRPARTDRTTRTERTGRTTRTPRADRPPRTRSARPARRRRPR